MKPAQLVINQVSETPQSAAQYFAQPHKDESEYNPDNWMCYMCTPEGADFAQANPMLPEIGQALLALNQQEKGAKYGGGKAGRKGAGKIQGKCWNCNEEGHTAAECKKPRKPTVYGKGAPKGGKKGYSKGGGKSSTNSISEDWTLRLHYDSPNLMLNYLQQLDDQILGNRTVSNDDCAHIHKQNLVDGNMCVVDQSKQQIKEPIRSHSEKMYNCYIVVVDGNDHFSISDDTIKCPLIDVKKLVAQHGQTNAPSASDKELNQLLKDIQTAGISAKRASKSKCANLDALDDKL